MKVLRDKQYVLLVNERRVNKMIEKNGLEDIYVRNKAKYFMSLCDFTYIYICVCSGYFSWPERGESPLSFHLNLSCQISLGQRYIFFNAFKR